MYETCAARRQLNCHPRSPQSPPHAQNRVARHVWIMALLILLIAVSATRSAQAAIPAAERQALVNLYTSTNGAGWAVSSGWNGAPGTECAWHGITCDAAKQHVTEIDLYNNHLSGSLPNIFGSLAQLKVFDGSLNQLSGSLPSLATLTNLVAFYAYSNQLTGSIPSFAGLTNLKYFFVHSNHLTGPIPTLSAVPDLTFFYVDSNQLTGTVPSLATLTKLKGILIDGNQLSGPMPEPPNPSSLQRGESKLCSNHLDSVPSTAWDTATGESPWYQNCTPISDEIFKDGFDP